MGKLNLFRKGRGKEYRQTKRAIKRQIRKTGGVTATAGADGKFTITGGSGAIGKAQSGKIRRKTARGAAEHMTAGIDDKTPFGGSDSQTWTGSVASRTKRSTDWRANKGSGSWVGTGTKAGVTTNVERKVDVTGPSVENVRGQIIELQKDNPVSMKSSAFKMKHSPFNQGFGSPLNWNDRSPLNNLKKDGELVPSTKGVYMKESSPLNDKESCKSPMVWHNNKCWTASEWETEVSKETTDDDLEVTTTKSKQKLQRGTEGKEETEDITAKEGCSKFTYSKCCNSGTKGGFKDSSAGCKKCQTCKAAKSDKELGETKKSECAQKGEGWKWDAGKNTCVKKTAGDDERLEREKEDVSVTGTATVITKVTDCPDGGKEYKLVDGKCIKKAAGGVNDPNKARTKKCRCKGKVTGEVPRSKHPQDCPPCDEKKEKDCTPKDCSGNRTWDADKCRCVKGPKKGKDDVTDTDVTGGDDVKKPGMKKVCTDWEWVEKGSGKGKKRSSAGPKPK